MSEKALRFKYLILSNDLNASIISRHISVYSLFCEQSEIKTHLPAMDPAADH